MAGAPVIEIEAARSYSSMWLAYVRAVDLRVHCARSLVGGRASGVGAGPGRRRLRLDEYPGPAVFYLCAVTYPYVWAGNAHLAFEHAPGAEWRGVALVPDVEVALYDAAPVTGWGAHSIPAGAAHAGDRLFATCRNWQFAWHLHVHRGVPLSSPPGRKRSNGRFK